VGSRLLVAGDAHPTATPRQARLWAGPFHPPSIATRAAALSDAYTGAMTDHQADLIVTDPDVVHGQARVRGTRIPVSVVLDCLAAGLGEDEILRQYPTLTVEGVRAAAAYGAALAREEIHPLPA
jgi:uncharacterized protein (DUF433 family)